MNYNSLYNKPTLNHKELIGDNKASDIGGMTEEDMQELLETDLTPYYSKDEIDDLFARSFVYREKSGSIVTFDCPSTSQSIPELTVGIEAVQSGSGDPSPQNVRPISGWSAVNAVRCGKNLFAPTYFTGAGWTKTEGNEVLDVYSGNKYDFYFRHGNVRNTAEAKGIFGKLMPLGVVTISFYKMDNTNDIVYFHYVGDTSWTNASGYITTSGRKSYTSLSDKICDGIALSTTQGASATGSLGEMQIEINSEQTTYTPYQGTTYTTALKDENDQPLTCYGGQLENVNGVQTLIVTHANIASYNGETINGPWISSMDVYSEGATPTTGAQVVYPLTTPTEIPQQSQAISTQDGTNNLWADSGEIEVKCLDRIISAGE